MTSPKAAAPDAKMVSREPTPEMIAAWRALFPWTTSSSVIHETWRAMYDAAHAASPAPVEGEVAEMVAKLHAALGDYNASDGDIDSALRGAIAMLTRLATPAADSADARDAEQWRRLQRLRPSGPLTPEALTQWAERLAADVKDCHD